MVVSPEGKLYDDEAESVHVPGKAGGMTILGRHAPLLAALGKGRITVATSRRGQNSQAGRETVNFDIEKGFIEVNEKRVELFIRKNS